MPLTFVKAIFELLVTKAISPASGSHILSDALAPSFTVGAPPGLFARMECYFYEVLEGVDCGTLDPATSSRQVRRVFHLASMRDFERLYRVSSGDRTD